MRTSFHHHCFSNNFGTMINHSFNTNFSSTSIFNNVGSFGCGMRTGFSSNFGFGFGLGLGLSFGNFFGGFFGGGFPTFGGFMTGGFAPFGSFMGGGFTGFPFGGFMGGGFTPFGGFMGGGYPSAPFGNLVSSTRNSSHNRQSCCSNNHSSNNSCSSNNTQNSSIEENAGKRVSIKTKKSKQNDKPIENNDTRITNDDIEIEDKTKNNKLKDVPTAVVNNMKYIAKDALKKYLKKGKLETSDVLIERYAEITSLDISGDYKSGKGVKNDYRTNDGNIVRTADGTILTLKFLYEEVEYEIQLSTNKTPKEGEVLSIMS